MNVSVHACVYAEIHVCTLACACAHACACVYACVIRENLKKNKERCVYMHICVSCCCFITVSSVHVCEDCSLSCRIFSGTHSFVLMCIRCDALTLSWPLSVVAHFRVAYADDRKPVVVRADVQEVRRRAHALLGHGSAGRAAAWLRARVERRPPPYAWSCA